MQSLTEQKWGLIGATIALLCIIQMLIGFLKAYVWRPRIIQKAMQAQGVSGPPPKLITGNLLEIEAMRAASWSTPVGKPGEVNHDYVSHLFPHFQLWGQKYGSKFVMWWGEEPAILETDQDLVAEVFGSKYNGSYGKHSRWEVTLSTVIGKGLAIVNGEVWYRRRQLTQPAFHAEKVKELASPIIEATTIVLGSWEKALEAGAQWTHDIAPDMVAIAADVISRAAFKSGYHEVNGAFEKQLQLLKITFDAIAWSFLPIYNYLPIPRNLKRWQLKSQIQGTLEKLIQAGIDAAKSKSNGEAPKDLLAMLLAANTDPENTAKGLFLTQPELMDEMKTFFAAGFDTISAAMIFTLLCLADEPIWQERVYEEIAQMCGDAPIDASNAFKLKVLGMVLNESMRLYPPAPQLARTAVKDVQLGKIRVPKGLSVFVCLPLMHRKPQVWGVDANEFKPERFQDGVASACSTPVGWMPFSFGPRSCVAKNFAMLEMKIVLAMIIRKYSFTLARTYLHNIVMEGVVLKAKHGVPLVITKRRATESCTRAETHKDDFVGAT